MLLAILSCFLVIIGVSFAYLLQSNAALADEQAKNKNSANSSSSVSNENSDTNSNISISNSIENNISGKSKAEIDNSIQTELDNTDADLTNNVQNTLNDNAQATVNNTIENLLKGKLTGTLNNQIDNQINGNNPIDIKNKLINNVEVNVNVNITNNVTASGKQASENQAEPSEENDDKKKDDTDRDKEQGEDTSKTESPEYVWGIDSASETTETFYQCVNDNFGNPEVVARYLGNNEGVSVGLTKEQVDLIHSKKDKILLIYNGFQEATGYENGKSEAQKAIDLAKELGVPKGVAIFADIEPTYPVTSDFIEGWYEELSSSDYRPGIYGVFDGEKALTEAFVAAVDNNKDIQDHTYLWSASPSIGITSQEDAPDFDADAPKDSLAWGWQYGIDAEACNIDTNLFDSRLLDVLWSS